MDTLAASPSLIRQNLSQTKRRVALSEAVCSREVPAGLWHRSAALARRRPRCAG